MAPIKPKDKLIVPFDLYKSHNGYILPQINEFDKENGITTIEQKYQNWSYHVQTVLNTALQDTLVLGDFDLTNFKTVYQRDIINIIVLRLLRAFYNDEIIDRDSNVNFSQQGGVQYTSNGTIKSKADALAFFNSEERLLIETSGLREIVFAETQDDAAANLLDNQFKDGPKVIEVNWGDKQDRTTVYDGQNLNIDQIFALLKSTKLNISDVATKVAELTGLSVSNDSINVAQGKHLVYPDFRTNKGDNEVAQAKDFKLLQAALQSAIAQLTAVQSSTSNALNEIESKVEGLESLVFHHSIQDLDDHAMVDSNNDGTFDVKTITKDDGHGNQIQKFGPFVATDKWTIGFKIDGIQVAHTMTYGQHRQYVFKGATEKIFDAFIDANGIITITKVSGASEGKDVTLDELNQVIEDTSGNRPTSAAKIINAKITFDDSSQEPTGSLALPTEITGALKLYASPNLTVSYRGVQLYENVDYTLSQTDIILTNPLKREKGTTTYMNFHLITEFIINNGQSVPEFKDGANTTTQDRAVSTDELDALAVLKSLGVETTTGEELIKNLTQQLISKQKVISMVDPKANRSGDNFYDAALTDGDYMIHFTGGTGSLVRQNDYIFHNGQDNDGTTNNPTERGILSYDQSAQAVGFASENAAGQFAGWGGTTSSGTHSLFGNQKENNSIILETDTNTGDTKTFHVFDKEYTTAQFAALNAEENHKLYDFEFTHPVDGTKYEVEAVKIHHHSDWGTRIEFKANWWDDSKENGKETYIYNSDNSTTTVVRRHWINGTAQEVNLNITKITRRGGQ